MTLIPLLLVVVPAVAGAITYAIRGVRFQLGALLGTAALHSAGVLALWLHAPEAPAPDALLGLDAPGLLFLTLTSLLFLVVSFYAIGYLTDGTHDQPSALFRFVPCLLWFLSAMTLVTVSQHLPLAWAAIEATTLASAPLIYFYRRGPALEAAWKYLLLCSVGIAIALLGTFFLGIAAAGAGGASPRLTIGGLIAVAGAMPPLWLRAAFVLALVGYGTKMGLAPLHTWLPDAHSQAPSPVSALLSGALLNCAFLGILRFHQVCLAGGQGDFARTLLLVMGFASLAVAAALMIGQRDYKRLLAYSSVENMGVLAVGVGIGGVATYGAMLHAVNHSLCKAGLFLLAGNVLRGFGTTASSGVRGILRRLPLTGVLLCAAMFAIGGAPPFGSFVSELTIFTSAISGPRAWLGAAFLGLLAIAFLGMAAVILPMAQGADEAAAPRQSERALAVLPPLVLTAGVLVLGLHVPAVLRNLLSAAAGVLGG